jgi:hypothetical protein
MSWWGSKSPKQTEPGPVAAVAVAVDREQESLTKVRALKAELARLDGEILAFKTRHRAKVSRFGVLLSVHSPSASGYEGIRCEWDGLLQRRDRIVAQWHTALRDWSQAKQGAK